MTEARENPRQERIACAMWQREWLKTPEGQAAVARAAEFDAAVGPLAFVLATTNRQGHRRFFAGFGKAGAVSLAWCVAGARLFRTDDDDLPQVIHRMQAKGYALSRWLIAPVREEPIPGEAAL